MKTYSVPQSAFTHFFTADTGTAPLWLIVRVYLGYEFFMAGWEKVSNPAWFGSGAGAALNGFVNGAVAKTMCAATVAPTACHPDVQTWYASFLQMAVLPHPVLWSNAVVVGELLIGVGLIVGLFTGVAAFFAFFMSLNFMFAGSVSINPILITLALGVMSARRVAGYWGLDYYARPYIQKRFCSPQRQ